MVHVLGDIHQSVIYAGIKREERDTDLKRNIYLLIYLAVLGLSCGMQGL